MFKNEKLYIAGPECFYTGGYVTWFALKQRAEGYGMQVTLPNNHPLDLENEDLQKRADSIFADLKVVMNDSTAIIANLEAYRGSEADCGTVFEIGMAYARGLRCYGYTRDKRPLIWKDQKYVLKGDQVYDEHGTLAPYKDLPFSPCVVGSTKIIEGSYEDCLKMFMTDIEEDYKMVGKRGYKVDESFCPTKIKCEKPQVYLATLTRYDEDAKEKYEIMKKLCNKYGLEAIVPTDWADEVVEIKTDNLYLKTANIFDNYQQHVRNCDIIIADVNNYKGYECSNDVAFECGMGFQLGKKLYGFMDDARAMKDRIPHLGEAREYRDMCGCNVENFNYPLNLMLGCSLKVFEGNFEKVIKEIAADFLQK